MEVQEMIINLDDHPKNRWSPVKGYEKEINELLGYYLKDLEGAAVVFDLIKTYADTFISQAYQEEIAFIAEVSDFSKEEVLVANLYYDILKSYFGCTAYAIDNRKELFHARNLDWHTENGLLSKYTTIFNFQKAGTTLFKSVGWKGFVGVLSGMKPQRFSVTLNAILSNDLPEIAYPISFFLRDVLEQCTDFAEAKQSLETKPIASDCLLLLSGISPNEFVVIERTPKRFATRAGENHIVVTNDYKILDNQVKPETGNILSSTSCGRYDRAANLLNTHMPVSIGDCLRVLQDGKVQMGITVQQMVFENRSGEMRVVKVLG
ncbi:MAG: C45 family peptidase [Bacteroidota bacterium]